MQERRWQRALQLKAPHPNDSARTVHFSQKLQVTDCQHKPNRLAKSSSDLAGAAQYWPSGAGSHHHAVHILAECLWLTSLGEFADLVQVSGSQLPGLRGKVDVVAVMHLGQVVEAAGLLTQAAVLSDHFQ